MADLPLAPKAQRFIAEYLIDMNAHQAAIRAGYSPKSARCRCAQLLADPRVRTEIQKHQKSVQAAVGVKAEQVLREYITLGFSNIGDYLEFGPDGVVVKASKDIPRNLLACVSEVREFESSKGSRTIQFKLHPKIQALDAICRMLGFDKKQDDGTAPESVARMLMEVLRAAGSNR